jgi:hypothetical protein
VSRPVGRPRDELLLERRRELVRLARRLRRLEAQASTVRGELELAVAEAELEGASVRAIGSAIELGTAATHRLLVRGRALKPEPAP